MAESCTLNHRGLYVVWLIILLCFIAEHDSHPTFKLFSTTRKQSQRSCNTTECMQKQKLLKQIYRILKIQQAISNALNRSKTTHASTMLHSIIETTASTTNTTPKPANSSVIVLKSIGTKQKNILKFKVQPGKGHTKIVSAQLLVVIKRRPNRRLKKKDKPRQTKRNKRVTIKIHEVNDTSGKETLLQTLKKRVKKTYVEKITLPAEVLQRYVDMDQSNVSTDENILKLRVTCQRCGKKIKPVLVNRSKKKKQFRSLKHPPKPFIVVRQYRT